MNFQPLWIQNKTLEKLVEIRDEYSLPNINFAIMFSLWQIEFIAKVEKSGKQIKLSETREAIIAAWKSWGWI